MLHLHNGMLWSRRKEGATTLCGSMDGTEENYAMSNEQGGERQKYHVISPISGSLSTEKNKQSKYNQRHWNKKQTDSNQRVGGMGIMGERRGRVVKGHI